MRPLRNFVPGLPVHVIHRGNNRQRIFTCMDDFLLFKKYLKEACVEHEAAVHAYVLMGNHLHLLATPMRVWAISKAAQSAMRRYTGYFNARYGRTGTLWEGRFHASSIESDRYFFACHRYIDLNPVRANLVPRPLDYRWSSHRHYAVGTRDELVTPHSLITALAADEPARQASYSHLFDEPMDPAEVEAIREAARGCRRLGGVVIRRPRGRRPAPSRRSATSSPSTDSSAGLPEPARDPGLWIPDESGA